MCLRILCSRYSVRAPVSASHWRSVEVSYICWLEHQSFKSCGDIKDSYHGWWPEALLRRVPTHHPLCDIVLTILGQILR